MRGSRGWGPARGSAEWGRGEGRLFTREGSFCDARSLVLQGEGKVRHALALPIGCLEPANERSGCAPATAPI